MHFIRRHISLIESMQQIVPAENPAFLKKVRREISRAGSGDWDDDYRDDAVLSKAIRQVEALMTNPVQGGVTGDHVDIWRAELRPQSQVDDLNFGSLGIYWSWNVHSAKVLHHDNAYDDFGREGLVEIMFEGEAKLSDVDWASSIAQNLILPGESEITMKDGKQVHLSTLWIGHDDHPVDVMIFVSGSND